MFIFPAISDAFCSILFYKKPLIVKQDSTGNLCKVTWSPFTQQILMLNSDICIVLFMFLSWSFLLLINNVCVNWLHLQKRPACAEEEHRRHTAAHRLQT